MSRKSTLHTTHSLGRDRRTRHRRKTSKLILCLMLLSPALPCLQSIAQERTRRDSETDRLQLIVDAVRSTHKDSVRRSLIRGMLHGLEGRRNVAAPTGWKSLAKELSTSADVETQRNVQRLSQIFGDAEALAQSLATLRDEAASIELRRSALAALVTQQYDGLASELEPLLATDNLRIDAIRAYSITGSPLGPVYFKRLYSAADADTKRAIVETLATRKDYAIELVAWMNEGIVERTEVPSYVARTMGDLLGKQFTSSFGEVESLDQDIASTIARYKSLITDKTLQKADASRGRTVFAKTCGACHQMYGDGGKVGPDLTGSNRANLDYFLLNSVAPSADVPEGYRTQIIQTADGRILTGVLAEEDSQRVVLKTVDQPRLVVSKDDIEARKVSDKSMMPDGQLDQLKPQQVLDLFKYMQTRSQVEVKQ